MALKKTKNLKNYENKNYRVPKNMILFRKKGILFERFVGFTVMFFLIFNFLVLLGFFFKKFSTKIFMYTFNLHTFVENLGSMTPFIDQKHWHV